MSDVKLCQGCKVVKVACGLARMSLLLMLRGEHTLVPACLACCQSLFKITKS